MKRFLILLLCLVFLFTCSFATACGGDTPDDGGTTIPGENDGEEETPDDGGETPDNPDTPVLPTEDVIIENGIVFELIPGTANYQVTAYNGDARILTVPDTIQGFRVTKICSQAFNKNTTLDEIIFEDDILEFETNAIYDFGAKQLALTLPKNVEIFPSTAIMHQTKIRIKSLTMPAHVIDQAFTTDSQNQGLKYVRITKGEIAAGTFSDQVNGNTGKTMARQVETLILDDEVTKVGVDCFRAMKMLKNLTLSNSLTELPARAFTHAHNLKEVNIPEGIEKIGEAAFSSCFMLREVTLPASLITLGHAFNSSYKINRVTIKEGSKLVDISPYAFDKCVQLFEVVNLSDLPIDFENEKYAPLTKYAKSIFTDAKQTNYSIENGYIYYINPEIGEYCLMGTDTERLLINDLPQTIAGQNYKIYDYAFYNESPKGPIIPKGCNYIGPYAFADRGNTTAMKGANFEDTKGWKTYANLEAIGTKMDLSSDQANKDFLTKTYASCYWIKN